MDNNQNKAGGGKKKIQYFQLDKYVDDIITEMKLGEVSPEILSELQNSIAKKLGDRILFTVVNNFGKNELKIFENMLNDHPELDELDVLWLVAHEVDGLKDKLVREINSLYAELVYDADKIEQYMKFKK